jgi:N-carbamoyl-L-amino-acid hydrolase
MAFARVSVKEITGSAPEIPSGPLHDAAEMADIVPTAMVFAQSSPGVSHTRIEDTPRKALDQSIRAFELTVERTLHHYAETTERPRPERAKPASARSRRSKPAAASLRG